MSTDSNLTQADIDELKHILFKRQCLDIAEQWLDGRMTEDEACDSLWEAGCEGGFTGLDGLGVWAEDVLRRI